MQPVFSVPVLFAVHFIFKKKKLLQKSLENMATSQLMFYETILLFLDFWKHL